MTTHSNTSGPLSAELVAEHMRRLVAAGDYDGAIALADSMLSGEIADPRLRGRLLFERGKLYWRTGRRDLATSDYLAACDADPDSPARLALDQARDIDAFFNHDLLNP